jgi:sn-glycerol 3-phosphate transport system permease protein
MKNFLPCLKNQPPFLIAPRFYPILALIPQSRYTNLFQSITENRSVFDARYQKLAWLLLLPHLLVTLVFFIWPSVLVVVQSLFYEDAFGIHRRFAGLSNFTDLWFDATYLQSFGVTLVISISITLLTLSLGLLLAVVVNQCRRSQSMYKTLLIWPYAVAPAIAGVLWRFLCQPTLGWLASVFHQLGYSFDYLTHPKQAVLVVVIAASWQQLSYNFLFFLAAIQSIPQTIIDASILDGASSWRRFWQITLPLISPTTFFLLIMNLIYAFFDTFGIIDILTRGGPGHSTVTLMYKIYQDGFLGMDYPSAAAESVILMVFVALLIGFQFKYIEKKVHYV